MSEEAFQAYLLVCQELYLKMVANGTWLWKDESPNSEDLVESKDT